MSKSTGKTIEQYPIAEPIDDFDEVLSCKSFLPEMNR